MKLIRIILKYLGNSMKKYLVLNPYQKYFISKYWLPYLILFAMAAFFTCLGFSYSYGYSFIVFFLYIIALLLTISVVANFDYSNIANKRIFDFVFENLNRVMEIMKFNACINIVLFILPAFFSWFESLENVLVTFASHVFFYSILICIGNNIGMFTLRNDTIKRIYEERTQIKTEIMRNDQ